MDLTIETLELERFLMIVVRCGCFCASAPLFAHKSINARLRILIGACIALTLYSTLDTEMPTYTTVFGFTAIMLKEAIIGLSIGFVSSIVMLSLTFAGEFIDREIGFSMSTNFDPAMGAMVTITAELYDKMVYLIILITNLHFYILKGLVSSYEAVPIGHMSVSMVPLYQKVVNLIAEYFLIGFRIAMPVFIAATMLNVILGVLAKSSPQMNMFAVGMQLKVFMGLSVLTITILFVPNITTYLMERMSEFVTDILSGL